jgi:H+/Cl- antiporter ClcA
MLAPPSRIGKLIHVTLVPEIKAILGGYVLDAFLSPMTLLIKGLGLALSVASGLSLGKEVRRGN